MDANTNEMMEETGTARKQKSGGGPLGWFSLGAILGAVIAVGAMTFAGGGSGQAALSVATIREAARQGVNDAIEAEATRTTLEMAQAPQNDAPVPKVLGPEKPPTENNADTNAKGETIANNITIRDTNIMGRVDAPVTIIEFSDFGCYYCTTFYNNTFNKIIDKYVNSGQVRFVYKHMPITSLHPGADMASLASECAADQGKFWEYHNVLFARNANGFAKDLMIQYAKEMKLDDAKFASCLDTTEIGQRVNLDMEQAAGLGLRGTPSFLINGKQLIGAQPYEVFVDAIEKALGKK